MEMRQSLAQKTWARWEKIRDKFSEGQWRLLLFCLVVGFVLAFAQGRKEEPKKIVKVEQHTKQVAPKEEQNREEPQLVEQEPIAEAEPHELPLWPVEGQIIREVGWYRSEAIIVELTLPLLWERECAQL